MEMYEDWPLLEFTDVRKGILSRFSADASDSVAHLLIKELVESLDKPQPSKISNEQELEWMMQIVNHSFSLSFANQRDYETIHSAVRIYLTWSTALTTNVHHACPQPLKDHPDRYFRRMLEAMRLVFVPREASDSENVGIKQATEMKAILTALRNLSMKIIDEFKDECWSKLILFLLAVNSQMLDDPNVIDEYHSHISSELLGTLFDCWTNASLLEFIPSLSYWKTFTNLSLRWTVHSSLIEQWGKKILPMSALLIKKTLKNENYENLTKFISTNPKMIESKEFGDTWFRFFNLIGNPAKILACEISDHKEQLSFSFYLCCLTYSRLIDVFYGDLDVSMDFHESEEMTKFWIENCKEFQDEWNRSYQHQRPSNMSSGSGNTDSGIIQQSNSGNSIGRKNTLGIQSSRQTTQRSSGRSGNLQLNNIKEYGSSTVTSEDFNFPELPKPKLGQYIYHYMKSNKFKKFRKLSEHLSSNSMLEVFLYYLSDAALQSAQIKKIQEDEISQRSMSSIDFDSLPNSSDKVTRRSFAQSTTSSSEYSLIPNCTNNFVDFPQMDGIAAGRAAALGALCKIVCEKSSSEELNSDNLAKFYLIMHKGLIERERLSLCSIIYYGTELFKLGLKGVEILLPNYLMAVDIVLTESMKVRLHPSVQEIEMRHTCIQSLASIVAWPNVFSNSWILDDDGFKLSQNGTNLLEQKPTYLDLRQRILKCLVHTLRNETDSTNLHLALSTCAIFCLESCRHDLDTVSNRRKLNIGDDEERFFAVSALKAVVSAICDNICKSQWTSELMSCLAALDCLNSLSNLPISILFYNDEMSTGSLIVASLCRFIDVQLKKPPMYHSRDLHSSVVAAYWSIGIWLTTAPKLAEIESCLATVAEVIEFGLTGGKNLSLNEHKPASLRVRDAAENLMNILLNFDENSENIIDEKIILHKYGSKLIDKTKFRHFILNQSIIISIHEASHILDISHGSAAVIVVTRTPYSLANCTIFELKSSLLEKNESNYQLDNSPGGTSLEFLDGKKQLKIGNNGKFSIDSNFENEGIKQFEFPQGFDKSYCKLDSGFPPVEIPFETLEITSKLESIKNRLEQGGGSASGHRDSQNVWIQSSLGALLTQQLKPQNPVSKVNSIRNFLYDLGFINGNSFNSVIQPLNSENSDEFYKDLHQIVDRTHVRIIQTVGVFYVKDGQKNANDILENSLYLDETTPEFCKFLNEIGDCVEVSNHPYWTGHWATAFSSNRKPVESGRSDRYILDGITHCLWWADNLLEVAFVLYSERSPRLQNMITGVMTKEPKFSVVKPRGPESVTDSAFEDDSAFGTPQGCYQMPPAAHHPTWHQLRKQGHLTVTHSLNEKIIEDNNNIKEYPIECKITYSGHSPHVRRCLSVSTAVNEISSQKTSPRIFVKNQLSRQQSVSPNPDFSLDPQFVNNNVFDLRALAKTPSPASGTYSLSYLKNLFRRTKTPDPDDKVECSFGDKLLNTDYVSKSLRGSSPTSETSSQQQSRKSDVSQNSMVSGTSPNYTVKTNRTSTVNSDTSSTMTRINSSSEKTPKRNIDQRVFVVWLERIEDMYHFPYEKLFEVTEDGSRYSSVKPDHVIIYLHLTEPELVRVHVDGVWTKYGQPGPLADGVVVSLGALPLLLKQTVSSIARRKCFEVDNFQNTSSRRKLAIQEFSKKYIVQQSYTEFLDSFIVT